MALSIEEMCRRPEYTPGERSRKIFYNSVPDVCIGDRRVEYAVTAGPLAGSTLRLWTPLTLVFRLKGRRGRYQRSADNGRVVWVEYK